MQVTTCWTEELNLPKTLTLLKSLARDHLLNGGDTGAAILALVESESWQELLNFELDYHDHWDVNQLAHCRQGLAFFQKLEALPTSFSKERVAIAKFNETERVCRETNDYFRQALSGRISMLPSVVKLLELARRKIRTVLGVCPKADNLKFHFGPGSTTDIRKTSAAPTEKFAAGFKCSANMLASGLLPTYLRAVPHWLSAFEDSWTFEVDDDDVGEFDYEAEIAVPLQSGKDLAFDPARFRDTTRMSMVSSTVPVEITAGKLVCVPKSAKTYRTIMIEPVLNGFVQQGIRHAMERRLEMAGLSTRDQSRNARLARQGSIQQDLATIDLSSASDLISYMLVKHLLPADWFTLLNSARTGTVQVEGSECTLEKYSSMGNAYTFPLETLIFWAISTAALDLGSVKHDPESVAVYGDDIIVPNHGYKHVKWGLEVLGFQLNPAKSYATGFFRESCGHDYYRGINIRPYYQKDLVSGMSLFSLHNFYYRRGSAGAERVLSHIPSPIKIYGPDGYGDGHLLGDWRPKKSPKLINKGYCGGSFETFSLKPIRKVTRRPGDWISPLYSVYMSDRVPFHERVPVNEAPTSVRMAKDGRPEWTYPGTNGYKRVLIYTFEQPL